MDFEFLKENTEDFLSSADDFMRKGKYRLCAFSIEQGLQLYLKYFLARKEGDFPKMHSIRKLISEVSTFCPRVKEVARKNPNIIGQIEDAYFSSRYFPSDFLQEEVKNMLKVAKRIVNILKKCL